MITSRSEPVFGGVYKLCAVNRNGVWEPRIKVSDTVEKTTNPGLKDVYRIYDAEGRAVADLICKQGEELDLTKPYRFVDPLRPWKLMFLENCRAKKLQIQVLKDGHRCFEPEPLPLIAKRLRDQLDGEIWKEEQRFANPHQHYLDMSPAYYEMKMELLSKAH